MPLRCRAAIGWHALEGRGPRHLPSDNRLAVERVAMQPEPANIVVRVANSDDAADAADVFCAAFAALRCVYRPTSEAAARQAERAGEGSRLVAEIAGRIVGTVQFVVHKQHVHLIGLAVHPDFQRMGVAGRMIEAVVARAPTLGRSVVVLDTIKETGNVPLFEKMGFRVVRENLATWCESDDYAEAHDVVMQRDVAYRGTTETPPRR